MKLEDAEKRYKELSTQASANTRTLALAGIAVVWVFREGSGASTHILNDLLPPLFWFIVTLSLDYLQYFLGTGIWLGYFKWKEKKAPSNDEKHDEIWPNILWVLFFAKGIVLIFGYCFLSNVILARLFAS